jgi:hypothetical protein
MIEFLREPARAFSESLLKVLPASEAPQVWREFVLKRLAAQRRDADKYFAKEHKAVIDAVLDLASSPDEDAAKCWGLAKKAEALCREQQVLSDNLGAAESQICHLVEAVLLETEFVASRWGLVARREREYKEARENYEQMMDRIRPRGRTELRSGEWQIRDLKDLELESVQVTISASLAEFIYGIANVMVYRRWLDEGCPSGGLKRHSLDCLLELQVDLWALASKRLAASAEKKKSS